MKTVTFMWNCFFHVKNNSRKIKEVNWRKNDKREKHKVIR